MVIIGLLSILLVANAHYILHVLIIMLLLSVQKVVVVIIYIIIAMFQCCVHSIFY